MKIGIRAKIYNIFMDLFEIFMIAFALSMDALAVAVASGTSLRPFSWIKTLKMGVFFGVFQALMPMLGWLVGTAFRQTITHYAPKIAFVLLLLIGGKMILDCLDEEKESDSAFETIPLLGLAVATSIDALSMGITFLGLNVPILSSSAIIGITTFCISSAGVLIGYAGFRRFGRGAGVAGGITLIVIGINILIKQ